MENDAAIPPALEPNQLPSIQSRVKMETVHRFALVRYLSELTMSHSVTPPSTRTRAPSLVQESHSSRPHVVRVRPVAARARLRRVTLGVPAVRSPLAVLQRRTVTDFRPFAAPTSGCVRIDTLSPPHTPTPPKHPPPLRKAEGGCFCGGFWGGERVSLLTQPNSLPSISGLLAKLPT